MRKVLFVLIRMFNSLFKVIGREIVPVTRLDNVKRLRSKLILSEGIDLILDVGANCGQYAIEVRSLNYKNKIISFEPVKETFQQLEKVSKADNLWDVYNYALGEKKSELFINVAEKTVRSSFLDMSEERFILAPNTKRGEYLRREIVNIMPLDGVFSELVDGSENIMLKIDTQGYERNVLNGALKSLPKIKIIQVEASLVPLYDGEMVIDELLDHMKSFGFELVLIEPGFCNPKTGRQLQVDCIFKKK